MGVACNGGGKKEKDAGGGEDTGTMDVTDDTAGDDTMEKDTVEPPDTTDTSGGDADAGPQETARMMLIHNAADTDLSTVDVFVGGKLWIDDLDFRTAQPFGEVPAGDQTVAIASDSAGSEGSDDTLDDGETEHGSWDVTITADTVNLAVAQGVASPNDYADNPEGKDTALNLILEEGAKEDSSGDSMTDHLKIVHGITDAAALDIRRNNEQPPGITDFSFGDTTDYTEMDAGGLQIFDVEPSATQGRYLSGQTQLSGGEAWVVVASGFLSPADNLAGPGPELVAFPAKTTDETDVVDGMALPAPARIQLVHTAPESNLDPADFYVGQARVADDLPYEKATPMFSVGAGVQFPITVAPSGSSTPSDGVFNKNFTLSNGDIKVITATGVTDATNYSVPSANFDLVQGNAQETESTSNAALNTFHGVMDAPDIDICDSTNSPTVAGLSYGSYTGIAKVPATTYTLTVKQANSTPCSGSSLATFDVDLSMAGGTYQTSVASGFMTPGDEASSSTFKLLSVFANGMVVATTPN